MDHTVASDTSVAFVIPLFTLLMSSPVMWHEEQLSNFAVAYCIVYIFQPC